MKSLFCELCNRDAAVYCLSDSAYLCWNCDSNVHQANFLVARHVRRTICSKCKDPDGNCISGVVLPQLPSICRSCSPNPCYDSDGSCSSSVSTCISSSSAKSGQRTPMTTTGFVEKKIKTQAYSSNMDTKAEAILVSWSRKVGGKNNNTTITLALHVFSICLARITSLPFRVTLASSFWLALKLNKEVVAESMCQLMRRVEEISGVPAKLILLSEKKIARALKINRKQQVDLTEGWAECSN